MAKSNLVGVIFKNRRNHHTYKCIHHQSTTGAPLLNEDSTVVLEAELPMPNYCQQVYTLPLSVVDAVFVKYEEHNPGVQPGLFGDDPLTDDPGQE